MARYLAYTSPARGHLYPIVPTLLELCARGHEVHVRTLTAEVPALTAVGLHADAIAEAIEAAPLDDWQASTPQEGLARVLAVFTQRSSYEVPDLQQAIATTNPDALLVDVTTVGAAAVAEASRLPWGHLDPAVPAFLVRARRRQRSHPGAVRDRSGRDPGPQPPRRQLGLAPLAGPAEVWRAPLHLYYTAEPFESAQLDLPASFRLVGPGVWEPPAEPPAWLGDLAEPIVLVSASSERQDDDALVRRPGRPGRRRHPRGRLHRRP